MLLSKENTLLLFEEEIFDRFPKQMTRKQSKETNCLVLVIVVGREKKEYVELLYAESIHWSC